MATLKEISEYTGFSVTTVSRVLSEDETFSVSEATRCSIFAAAEKLNYKCKGNKTIKRKNSSRSFKVGIVEMEYDSFHLKDSYYIYMRNSVESACFNLKIETVPFRFNAESNEYENISGDVDGIVAIGQFSEIQVRAMEQWTENIVFIDSSPSPEKYFSVVPNYETGIRQGLDYLYENGHRNIAFAGVKYTLDSKLGKITESRRVLFDNIIKEYPDVIAAHIDTPSGSSGTAEAVLKHYDEIFIDKNVTAVFAFNEPTAIGVLRGLESKGKRVPDDISVLSYNDTVLAVMTQPQLTGIHIPMTEMANAAVFFLDRKMRQESGIPLKILVPTSITHRDSTKAL
ncbi:LacI family DNA-binding transcriptional regulator [Pseudobutyrivibrio xylanivorans]|uniref:LacI family transcriptional regulator n=1 Tax=Pseudobutyrivibrio xylanivorans TaxID=185007 RepID=A0A5P6VTS7_PSEXY|nr:LacI family DNA-binding transcriptional regulator [Pseudobutyrivibrio xylanivorans]QFJ55159.1 LacI family transcriptional regulator [Pseudobutyrivibrio xylanivorans]